MSGRPKWTLALWCACSSALFAHNAPPSFVKLEFLEQSVHAEILVPESELEFAQAAEQPSQSFENYLLQHVAAETRTGASWKISVGEIRRVSYLDHAYFSAAVVMTPPTGSPTRSFVFSDDAVTHEVRNHMIVVLARIGSNPELVGALQYPERRLKVDALRPPGRTPIGIPSR